jgi:hypothetical protein
MINSRVKSGMYSKKNAHAIQMAVDSQLEIGNMLLLLTAHMHLFNGQ